MRKSFKKPLIYLLISMMLMPTWLVTGMTNVSRAEAGGALLDSYSISNQYISPNGDNIKDSADISLKFSEITSVNVEILNSSNTKIKDLCSGTNIKGLDCKWNGTDSSDNVVDDGAYTIKFSYNGGATLDNSKSITVDKIAPSITGVNDGDVINQDVTPIITDDNLDVSTTILNGDAFISGTTIDESKDFILVATDLAGNSKTVKFTIDKVAPTIIGIEDGAITNKNITLSSDDSNAVLVLNNKTTGAIINPFVSGLEVSDEGDYILTATDSLGNFATVSFTIDKTLPIALVVLQVSTSTVDTSPTVTINVENGASWQIVNGSTVLVSGTGTGENQTVILQNLAYGTYNLSLIATDVAGNSTTIALDQFIISAPLAVTTVSATTATDATVSGAIAEISNDNVSNNSDSGSSSISSSDSDQNGKIKGTDSDDSDDSSEEKVNWTPWIVLFILIILAGAATGGYFYWFAGEDEISTVAEEPKKIKEPKAAEKKASPKPQKKNTKKAKRW